MSLERYGKMQIPFAALWSGLASVIANETTTGMILILIGALSAYAFRKEIYEVITLADNDLVKP